MTGQVIGHHEPSALVRGASTGVEPADRASDRDAELRADSQRQERYAPPARPLSREPIGLRCEWGISHGHGQFGSRRKVPFGGKMAVQTSVGLTLSRVGDTTHHSDPTTLTAGPDVLAHL